MFSAGKSAELFRSKYEVFNEFAGALIILLKILYALRRPASFSLQQL